MILRHYQKEMSYNIRQALKKYRKALMNLAMGGGKTVITADIFRRAIINGIKPVFLTDRIEIARKTVETFKEFGIDVQLITSDVKVIFKADCYVAMVETFYRRVKQGNFPKDKVKLLFCDECHMSVFNKVIDMFTDAYICGLTATPVSSTFNLNKVYNHIVTSRSIPELISEKFLCPSVDIGQREYLQLKEERGEFSLISQRDAFTSTKMDEKFIDLWLRHAKDRSTITYCMDLSAGQKLSNVFTKDLQITNCFIHAKTPDDERESLIRDYNNGNIQVLFNVDVASKGFDSPITSCIGHHCSTMSISKWFQRIGRGGRPFPGKENFITIDTGNNILRHGSFNDFVDWEYLFHNPEKDIKKQKSVNTKWICPVCSAYLTDKFQKYCIVCSTNLLVNKAISIESMMPEELKEKPIKDMTFEELMSYQKFKGYKHGWAFFKNKQNQERRMRQGSLW